MARNKRNKRQEFDDGMFEYGDAKEQRRCELVNFNFPIRSKFKNEKQKLLSNTIKENRITFVSGSPGSGKTFIALKTALEILKKKEEKVGNILLTTPIVEVGEGIGFLPGDIGSKVAMYFEHFYDNMDKIVGEDVVKFLKQEKIVEEKIVNFVRGATFGKYDTNGEAIGSICILDECQNYSIHELKTYISRLGENSKMIILGDLDQSDVKQKKGNISGLEDAIRRFEGMNDIGIVSFTDDDIVRDKFLIDIMKKYKD